MFRVLSAALEGALAPDIPPVVDFRHQWNLFLRFYAEHKPLNHKSQPVEKTYLVFHLNNMLKLLLREQRELQERSQEDSLGACMEFLIHHQVLDILSSICQADTPPGIRPYIFNYFIFLLTRIRQTILPYVNVYLPMRRLLMLSTMVKASPTENQELTFITSLVSKVKASPELLPLFAHEARPGDVSHISSRRSSTASSMLDLSSLEERLDLQGAKKLLEDFESSHLVVSALVNLVDSADYLVAVKAMDALLVVCGLEDEEAAANAVRGTPLAKVVGKRLKELFLAIPGDVEAAMVEEVTVNWVEAHHLLQQGGQAEQEPTEGLSEFHGKQELVAFFSWLDFLDSLVSASTDIIATAICESFKEAFLEGILEGEIMEAAALSEQEKPDGAAAASKTSSASTVRLLALLAQTWTHLKSDGLAGEFAAWLFGDADDGAAQPELNGVVTHPLKHALLTLCLSKDQDVTLETLSMLDVILERPCQPILQSLALASLSGRGYFHASMAEAAIASWSDEEDERERNRPGSALELTPPTSAVASPTSEGADESLSSPPPLVARRRPSPSPSRSRQQTPSPSPVLSRTMAPTNIARVINAWLYLVPDELRSADSARDSGYEQYVKNAQTQVSAMFKACEGFGWPREATGPERSDTSSSDSRPEADPTRLFYEGEFLHTLFDMLSTLLERDYDVNLQVTSLLSRLCQLPHPFLHEYLLNPTVPASPGARTMHSVLRGVLATAKRETAGVQQLARKVYVCRKTLLGSHADRAALNLTRKETRVIDGLIVLEEFSKEVAAIALVKYHLAS